MSQRWYQLQLVQIINSNITPKSYTVSYSNYNIADRNIEKEDLADYVAKKRQMFLVQYSLAVKREEMKKLEELASAEERKLEQAEKFLEEDAAMFDEFLKENDRNSVEAIKM